MIDRRRASGIVAAIAAVWICASLAQRVASADDRPATRVARAASPIRIDGRGDESAWNTAEWIVDFTEPAAGNGKRPMTRTRARLLWDDGHLYFLAEMEDAELVVASRADDDQLWLGDVFELFFKPAEAPAYYELQVNPANARLDMYLPHRATDAYERWRTSRPFAWETMVQTSPTGWVVEGRIPWSDFAPTGGRPSAGDIWRFALSRYDYTTGAQPILTSSAHLTRADFHRWEEWSEFQFSRE